MSVHRELAAALRELEAALRTTDQWRMPRPDPIAFESIEPFCADTMALPQWLRFVFIVRLDALVDAKAPMPAKCEVAPAVEAWLAQSGVAGVERRMLIQAVESIDRLVTEN
ncbi:MAG: YqcC family protein [Halomonas sp.]|uniref:YqcC family protein n=1 Tax=Halomonas sp. TaxID=1486246 RepID=UPI003970FC35